MSNICQVSNIPYNRGVIMVAEQVTQVNITVQELISLMSSEVARKVTEELREREILPLYKKLSRFESDCAARHAALTKTENIVNTQTSVDLAVWKGYFKGMTGAGMLLIGIATVYHYILVDIINKFIK
jgi:hypothetical protein